MTKLKKTLEHLLQGPVKKTWERSTSNEFGHLTKGNIHGVKGTNTMEFISKHDLPPHAKVTCASFVCDIRPLKTETHRVQLVVGGDRLAYDEDTGSPAASLLETKVLLNSVIGDAAKGAKFMTCDIKNFFLSTPMLKPEYMKIPKDTIPPDILS